MRRTGKLGAFLRGLKTHASDERGATAVEFALVAMPFFLLICGIMELAFIFIISISLENSTVGLARTIRTGELQTAGGNAAAFKADLCKNMGWLQADCSTKLRLDVRTYSSFSGTNNQGAPITDGAWNDPAKDCFQTGGPGDIVLVRAYYEWDLIAPGFSKAFETLNGGKTVISAATTFRNEPYGSSSASAACPA